MTRTTPWLVGLAVFAIALAPGRVAAQGAEPGDVAKQLQQLQAQIKLLTEAVNGVQRQMETVPDPVAIDAQIRKYFARTQEEIETLKREIATLKNPATTPRVSAYAAPATTGRVHIVNSYPLPRTVIVNGRSYRLPPGGEQFVENVPVGPFSFEVMEYHLEPQQRMLAAGQTYNITVYPR